MRSAQVKKLKSASKLDWVDGDTWAARSTHWKSKNWSAAKTKISPRRTHEPLIVAGYGAGLAVRNGALCVRDGYTHHPQPRAEYRFFPKDPNLPSRIVIVDGAGSLSFAAIDWLAVQELPLIRVNWRGEVQGFFGQAGYCADAQKTAAQKEAQANALSISIDLIRAKIDNCIATLEECITPSPFLLSSLRKLEAFNRQLLKKPPTNVASLLAVEGNAAFAYFAIWRTLEIRWKGTGRRPIPSDWYRCGPRSSVARQKLQNRNAMHPVNAMLNYGYGVLESQARLAIIAEGLDPTISYLHSNKTDRSGLVFDLMEPLRPIVDRVVLRFIQKETFHPSDFTLRADGVCRLNPELARQLTQRVLARISNADSNSGRRSIRRKDHREALQLFKM